MVLAPPVQPSLGALTGRDPAFLTVSGRCTRAGDRREAGPLRLDVACLQSLLHAIPGLGCAAPMRTFDVAALLESRWAPLVAALVGSLVFVAVVVLIVPSRFGENTPEPVARVTSKSPSQPRSSTAATRTGRASANTAAPVINRSASAPMAHAAAPSPVRESATVAESDAELAEPSATPEATPPATPLPPPRPVSPITGNADDYPIGPKND